MENFESPIIKQSIITLPSRQNLSSQLLNSRLLQYHTLLKTLYYLCARPVLTVGPGKDKKVPFMARLSTFITLTKIVLAREH